MSDSKYMRFRDVIYMFLCFAAFSALTDWMGCKCVGGDEYTKLTKNTEQIQTRHSGAGR